MSALNSSQQEGRELGDDLSKRQRMKLQMAMQRLNALQNQEIKHPKRRGRSSHHANQPTRRKEVKIDPYPSQAPLDQPYSSPINSSEPLSTTPNNPAAVLKPHPHHLNPRYRLPEADPSIFNYLLAYTYNQGEKRLEKECQDWSMLDDLQQAPLTSTPSAASVELCQKINGRVKEMKERLREPLGKTHRELNQRFLKNRPSYSYSITQTLMPSPPQSPPSKSACENCLERSKK